MAYSVGSTTVIDNSFNGFLSNIYRSSSVTNSALTIYGGTPSNVGAAISLYGPTASGTLQNRIVISQAGTERIGINTIGTISFSPSANGDVRITFDGDVVNDSRATRTSAFGFRVTDTFTGGTFNYAFRSDISNGTNRWAFHNDGGADNLLGKKTGSGTNTYFHDAVNDPAASNSDNGVVTIRGSGIYSASVTSSPAMKLRRTDTGQIMQFFINVTGTSTQVGSISVDNTSTTYNTTSDIRLKENILDCPSASEDIDAIKICSFNWKINSSYQKYGVVAQELINVVPFAVTKGDVESDMWSVDYSKLVPMMIKEIQSLRKRVEELENNV